MRVLLSKVLCSRALKKMAPEIRPVEGQRPSVTAMSPDPSIPPQSKPNIVTLPRSKATLTPCAP